LEVLVELGPIFLFLLLVYLVLRLAAAEAEAELVDLFLELMGPIAEQMAEPVEVYMVEQVEEE
jgi:hypothetical protein